MTEDNTGAMRLAWITALEQCESRGNSNAKVFDSNSKWSKGILQFQDSTFHSYGTKYNLPHTDIYSEEQQELIALAMLNDGLWRAWYNCGKSVTKQLGYAYPADV